MDFFPRNIEIRQALIVQLSVSAKEHKIKEGLQKNCPAFCLHCTMSN